MTENKQADNIDISSDETVAEEITEQRTIEKQENHYFISLLLLAVLVAAGVAAWYYQSMWLPQAKQWATKLIPAQAAFEPMAAPRPDHAETEYVVSEQDGNEIPVITAAKTTKKSSEESVAEPVAELEKAEHVFASPVAVSPGTTQSASDDERPSDGVTQTAKQNIANDTMMENRFVAGHGQTASPEKTGITPSVIPATSLPVTAGNNTLDALLQARQVFWSRDLASAEEHYQELLQQNPAVVEAWGELGNIYYARAKWQQAAEAYAEAAMQLLEQGQYTQAMFLHYIVRGLDQAQAQRIETKVHTMQSGPQE